jgi:hypothetical protein
MRFEDFIEIRPDVRSGKPCFKGTRIRRISWMTAGALLLACSSRAPYDTWSDGSAVYVEGTVQNASRTEPLAGIVVRLVWVTSDRRWVWLGGTVTDQGGRYRLGVRVPRGVPCNELALAAVSYSYLTRITEPGAITCRTRCADVAFDTEPILSLYAVDPGEGVAIRPCRGNSR